MPPTPRTDWREASTLHATLIKRRDLEEDDKRGLSLRDQHATRFWVQVWDLRELHEALSDDSRLRHGSRRPTRRVQAARRELAILDEALTQHAVRGGKSTLERFWQRARDIRLVAAVLAIEGVLIEMKKIRTPQIAATKAASLAGFLKHCLFDDVDIPLVKRTLESPTVQARLYTKGVRQATVVALDALTQASERTIYRALKTIGQEFILPK